jgi:hypothetical protein
MTAEGWFSGVPLSEGSMEQTIFMVCMFFGVAAVALIAFTLLFIALGRVKV